MKGNNLYDFVNTMNWFADEGYENESFENANDAYNSHFDIPTGYFLDQEDMDNSWKQYNVLIQVFENMQNGFLITHNL